MSQPCLHSASLFMPLPAAQAREGTLRAGPKGSTWLGRAGKQRVGSSAGGQDRKRGRSLGSGRASYPAPPSHPHPSALLISGEEVTAKLTTSPAAPAVSSCAKGALGASSPCSPAPRERAAGSRRERRARASDPAKPHGRKCLDWERTGAPNFRSSSPT